jgi:hypothetical protein
MRKFERDSFSSAHSKDSGDERFPSLFLFNEFVLSLLPLLSQFKTLP